MLTLYLCRHAKSSWADPGQDDHDRPLNARGMRDAPLMAGHFKDRNEPVDLLLSSTALRALTTARAFADAWGALPVDRFDPAAARPQLVLEPALYHPSPTTILKLVNNLPASVSRAMFFGHNPGFSEAVDFLASESLGSLPTCAVVRIDFPVRQWVEVSRDLGTLVWHDRPKDHPEMA